MNHLSLSDEELDELDELLCSEIAPEECLNLEALDGLFCAVAVGPREISSNEYLPLVWGGPTPTNPKFDLPRAMELIEKHRLSVHEQLNNPEALEDYIAAIWTPDPEPEPEDTEFDLGADWAVGFGMGMQICRDEWEKAMEDSVEFQSLMVPIMLLEMGEHPEDENMVVSYEAREELVDVLPEIALGIRSYFRPN